MPPTRAQRWLGYRRVLASAVLLLVACSPPVVVGPTAPASAPSAVAPGEPQGSASGSGRPAPGTGQPAPQPLPLSRQDLIDAALSNGQIDLVTSLVYRADARFGLPELPAEYASAPSRGDDAALFAEIVDLMPTLSEADQQRLAPFVVRPTEPGSVFSARAIALGALQAAAGSPEATATPQPTECRDWTDSGTQSAHFKVWACTDGDPQSAAADVASVAALLDELWVPMTKSAPEGMGPPIPDGSGSNVSREYGGDGRIDVYELRAGEGVYRGGLAGVPTDSIAAAVPSPPYYDAAGNALKTSSGFILVDRARIADRDQIRRDLIHEFFHVLQNAHNRVGPVRGGELQWFEDASATWAETYYFRSGSAFVHTWFTSNFQLSHVGLEAAGGPQPVDTNHPYAAYIWPFFMEQELGASAVFKAWVGIEGAAAGDFNAVSNAIDAQLPFATHFRDFAVRNLNRQLEPSQPRQVHYVDLDKSFPDGQPVPINAGEIAKADRLNSGPVSIEPLAAVYTYLIPDPDARDVTIDLGGLASQKDLDGDVLLRINGTWERRPIEGSLMHLCRDDPADNFDQMYLVLSDHGRDAPVTGGFSVLSRAGCGDLVGSITWSTSTSVAYVGGGSDLSNDTVSLSIRASNQDGQWVNDGSTFSWSGHEEIVSGSGQCPPDHVTSITVGGGDFTSAVENLEIGIDPDTNNLGVVAVVTGELFTHSERYDGAPGEGCSFHEEDSTQGGPDDPGDWGQMPVCHNLDGGLSGVISADRRTADFGCTSSQTNTINQGDTETVTYNVSGILTFLRGAP